MKEILQRFLEDLKCHGYLPSTQDCYCGLVATSLREMAKPVAEITLEDLRLHQVRLVERGLNPQTVNLRMASLRFLFLKTLNKDWAFTATIPRVKRRRKIPVILSPAEVAALINATINLKHRTILMTMYSCGLRSFEAVNLKTKDIDSKRMVIEIMGKGGKNRFGPLSPELLKSLRIYWKEWEQDKTHWLFPSAEDPSKNFSPHSVRRIVREAKIKAKITKPGNSHLLRHYAAIGIRGIVLRLTYLSPGWIYE